MENITDIVNQFKRLNEPERLILLQTLLEGSETKTGLTWRANLVTALREHDLYPYLKERPDADSSN